MVIQVLKAHKFIFIILLVIIYAIIGVFSALPKRPQRVHQWAQADRASVAKCYYEESMNFFLPRTHHRNESKGIVGMEFPFVNYTAAVLYKIFGFHEILYRLTMMLIVSGGIFCAYSLSYNLLKNSWLSMGIVFVWMLSPVLNYYTPNFVPDAASMGFAMVSWYFIFKYLDTKQRKNILWFMLFGSLAALIKISSLISVVAVGCLVVLDYLNFYNRFRKQDRWLWLCVVVLVIAVTFSWYTYARHIQQTYQSAIFTLDPHYITSWEQFHKVTDQIFFYWFDSYYSPVFWWILLFSALYFIWQWRRVDRFLFSTTLLLYLGNTAFVALMYEQYAAHDYYLITLLPAGFFHLLLMADVLNKHLKTTVKNYVILPLLMVMVVHSVMYSRQDYIKRYEENWMTAEDWRFEEYYDIEPYLRSLGISPLDRTVVIYDNSFNILLYLMNQRGFAVWNVHEPDYLAYPLRCQVKYIVLNDKNYVKEHPQFAKYFNNKIGDYKGIEIFKVSY